MRYQLSVKYKLTFLFGLVLLSVVLLISFLFYQQFRESLNNRVLLQLASIQQLKRVQLEDYISEKVKKLQSKGYNPAIEINLEPGDSIFSVHYKSLNSLNLGVSLENHDIILRDLTLQSKSKKGIAILIKGNDSIIHILNSRLPKLEKILLEHTGMGETGETYLVGEDYTMRSISRFFPELDPASISVQTEGVEKAIKGENGSSVFLDYRGESVFSVYNKMSIHGLNWIILSEIDEREALLPLDRLKNKLTAISLLSFIVALILVFSVSASIVRPINKMKYLLQEMSLGKFDQLASLPTKRGDEIDEMYVALGQLLKAFNNIMQYADHVGQQNFEMDYQPLSEHDVLGKSLITMKEKLLAYAEKEEKYQIENQRALLLGLEDERARISKELHDGLGPLVTTLRLYIQAFDLKEEETEKVKEVIDDIIYEVRRISNNLMPQALMDFGVGEALANLVEHFRKIAKMEINFINALDKKHQLPPEINIGIYRIGQEALNNGIKHANAQEINMSITEFEDTINFYYKDDGIGFDSNTISRGSGLQNMKERCRLLNGDFHINSSKSKGTEIEVIIKK